MNQTLYSTHITLYMAAFPLKNIPFIKNSLKQIATRMESFRIDSLKYRENKDGYIDVSFKRSGAIVALQEDVVRALNPLREGLIRKKERERLRHLAGLPARNIRQYGYRNVFREFTPHLTLTKLRAYKKGALKALPPRSFSFPVKEIGIFYLGEYGSCKKLVAKFKLKSSSR